MTVFCMSHNFFEARFFGKLTDVVDSVFKVHFIALLIILNQAVIFEIFKKYNFLIEHSVY